MAANKTTKTKLSVDAFIKSVENENRRSDSLEMISLMREITGCEPKMWGSSLIGFGTYHYKYESGREGDFFLTGFSPRKAAFTIYIIPGFSGYPDLMKKLGPHKTGKSCLYLKNLDVTDRTVLERLIRNSVEDMRSKYDCG